MLHDRQPKEEEEEEETKREREREGKWPIEGTSKGEMWVWVCVLVYGKKGGTKKKGEGRK